MRRGTGAGGGGGGQGEAFKCPTGKKVWRI